MAYVIIPKETNRQHESVVLQSFIGNRKPTAADREAAAVISARTREAVESMKKMEGKRR